jgi:Ca-activated chloride channel family protein
MASCLPFRPIRQSQNLHLNTLMRSTPNPALFASLLCLTTTLATAPGAPAQSDRPPWARKSTSNSSTKATTTTAPASPVNPLDIDSEPAQQQRGKIRVNVQLVNVLASVLDDHNRPAPDLPREAFQIFEEGVEQKLAVFESETEQPLDLALMIDASLSAHKEITFEQEAAARFIRQILRPGDRLSVFSVGEDVTQLAGFSDNVATLEAAVHRMPSGSGTSLYDAILLASRTLERRGDDRRRVIILVTDAGETTSYADFDAARKAAVKSGALLYTIVVRPVKNESGRNTAGEHALETITDTMGGAMFYPDQVQELDGIFDRINRELRTQYRVGYYPEPRGPANTYRKIEIKVTGNYQVRHRKTYLTGPQ